MDKDNFPAECRGCYANCYACIKENNGHRLSEIRQLVAKRKLKIQAVSRLTREIAMIDEQLESMQ